MLGKLLGAGLLLATLAGCTKLEGRTCTSNEECGAGGICDTGVGLCYASGTEPETEVCTPACAEYQACTTGGCKERFLELKILSPASNALLTGGPVEVSAQLVANPTYANTTQYPETLSFSALQEGGGGGGTFGTATRNGDTYTALWTLPAVQASVTVTVAHPVAGAVPNATVNVQVDTVPPAFTVAFSNPPARSPGTAATQANEQDPTAGYEAAFRRDEPVTVKISANESVSNVTLTVVGIGPGSTAGQTQSPVTVQPGGTCDGSPVFCGNAIVDLSLPEMSDIRGSMEFRVEGQDAAGNPGSASGALKVTRWKWAFDAAGTILGTPAIGNKGTLYVGTSVAGNGKTLAVRADGSKHWEFATGDVLGSPAVGEFSSNEEYVYVAAKTSSNVPTFYALRGIATGEKQRCTYNGTNELPSAIAVGMTQGTLGLVETGVTVHNAGQVRIVELRPAGAASTECLEVTGPSVPSSVTGGAVVLNGQHVFYGTADFRVTSYDLATGSNAPRSGWPQDTAYLARGLALSGTTLYGGASSTDNPSQGSLFSVPTAGGSFSLVYPATASSRVFNLAIGNGDIAYFGAETGASTKELLSLSLTTPGATPMRVSNVGTLRGAPVVAKNDRLYTFNSQGQIGAWVTSTRTLQWQGEVAPGPGTADVSPTLDCRRDPSGQAVAGPGTLYVPAATKLYAVIVDSSGLDPTAPWPKFQHDARNTGNPATPITTCP